MKPLQIVVNDRLLFIYVKRQGKARLLRSFSFSEDFCGNLIRYLKSSTFMTCRLFLDLSEEEFFLDEIPQCSFWQKRELLLSCRQRYFSDHELASVIAGGRDKNSRILCHGFKTSDMIEDILKALREADILVKGIYSIPVLLLQTLVHDYRPGDKHTLLISSHCGQQWRYSLYHNNFLILSRSVHTRRKDIWADIYEELRGTIKFAKLHHYISKKGNPEIQFAGPALPASAFGMYLKKKMEVAESECRMKLPLYERIVSEFQSSKSAEISRPEKTPASNYRRTLAAHLALLLSVVILMMSLTNGLGNLALARHYVDMTQLLKSEHTELRRRLSSQGTGISHHGVSADELKAWVTAFGEFSYDAGIRDILGKIAKVLTTVSAARLQHLSWGRTKGGGPENTGNEFSPRRHVNIDESGWIRIDVKIADKNVEAALLSGLRQQGLNVRSSENSLSSDEAQSGLLSSQDTVVKDPGKLLTLYLSDNLRKQ